jgi:hypothetical protein
MGNSTAADKEFAKVRELHRKDAGDIVHQLSGSPPPLKPSWINCIRSTRGLRFRGMRLTPSRSNTAEGMLHCSKLLQRPPCVHFCRFTVFPTVFLTYEHMLELHFDLGVDGSQSRFAQTPR